MEPPSPRARFPYAPAHRCWACGDAIDPLQAASQAGVCGRFECRAARARRQQDEDVRIASLRAGAARDALRARGLDPDRVAWSLTPAHRSGPAPLTPQLREAFLRHLRRTVEEAGARAERDAPVDSRGLGPPGPDEARALGVACANCRGWCCRFGGTHAFLTPKDVRRVQWASPDPTSEGIVELYSGYLRDTHVEGACVFLAETGCRLPRDIRSDTCNRYLCPDLLETRGAWRREGGGGPGGRHHFVALTRAEDRPTVAATEAPDVAGG